jgi:hypothetical protein
MSCSVVLAVAPITVGYLLVLIGAIDPHRIGNIAALTACLGITGILLTPILCKENQRLRLGEKIPELVLVWTVVSTVAQFCWELPWLVLHRALDGATATDRWAWPWWLYGVADRRWIEADPFIVAMESSMVVTGVLAVLAFIALRQGQQRKVVMYEIIIGLTQFVLVLMYYLVEILAGNPNINPDLYQIFIKYIYMNSFWCILPLIQILHGFSVLNYSSAHA